MTEARVKAGLWVSMALRLGDQAGRPGVIIRRGDPDAGGVLMVLRNRAGVTVLSQMRAGDEPAWLRATGAAPVTDSDADAYIARQLRFDPDLWVIEFDAPDMTPPFEARIV